MTKTDLLIFEPGFLRYWLLPSLRKSNYRVNLEHLLVPEIKKCLKKEKQAGSLNMAVEATAKVFPLVKTGIIIKIKYNNEL